MIFFRKKFIIHLVELDELFPTMWVSVPKTEILLSHVVFKSKEVIKPTWSAGNPDNFMGLDEYCGEIRNIELDGELSDNLGSRRSTYKYVVKKESLDSIIMYGFHPIDYFLVTRNLVSNMSFVDNLLL